MGSALVTPFSPPAVVLSTVTGLGRARMDHGTLHPRDRSASKDERHRRCLDRIRSKDADALTDLYDETSSLLYGLALRILNDTADAEEIVLDVYQHVWNSAHTFDDKRGTVWNWLVILTRSRAIDRLRRAGSRRNRELPVAHEDDMPGLGPDPELESVYRQERGAIFRALAVLCEAERRPIELAFFNGLTHVEVAAALNQPLGTIKTRIRVGLRKLRDALAPVARA